MIEQKSPRGGTHEQHGKPGSQSHKNGSKSSPGRGGSSEQHIKPGSQGSKNK